MSNGKATLDLHNRIGAQELIRLLDETLSALERDPALSRKLPPLMVWGAPGIGKSTIFKEAAARHGIGFIDVRLAQREPVDVRGLPVPTDDGVKWLVSSEWPRDPQSKGIILFDEITAADRSLQVAAYEFILDRRLGDLYQVPPGWFICAAGNRVMDRAVATTMSSALANRFMHVELAEDAETWVAWAIAAGVNPSVVGFIRFRPSCLFRQEGENLERGWPSPRAWERVGHMADLFGADEALLRVAVQGLVGEKAGVEFLAFRRSNAHFDDVLAMLTDENAKIMIPESAEGRYAFCSATAYLLWRGRGEDGERRRLDGFFRIAMELPPDFSTMLMMDVISDAKGDLSERAAKVFRHPGYTKWTTRFGDAMRKRMKGANL